jgi:hypothetical protein
MALPAVAQTGARTVEPSAEPLAAEKQALVKDYAKRAQVPEAQAGGPVTVGMAVPEGIELWGLPQDSVTEVPTVTSYRFFRSGHAIAVVDPESRKVVQIVPN